MTYIALFDSWLVHGVSRDRRSLARDLGPSGGGYQPGAISRAGPVIDEKACAGGQFVAGRQADGGAGKGQPREQNSRTVHLLIWARAPSAGQGVLLSPAMVGVRYLIASAVAAPGLKLLVLGVSAVTLRRFPLPNRAGVDAATPCACRESADGGDDLFGHQLRRTNELAPTTVPCATYMPASASWRTCSGCGPNYGSSESGASVNMGHS